MTDTTMSEAFRAAGHEPPGDKLFRLMREATLATGGLFEPTSDAFIKALLAENDAQLIWEFMIDVRMPVVRKLFGVVHHIVREEQRKAGRSTRETHASPAGSSAGGEWGHEITATHRARAPSPPAGRPSTRAQESAVLPAGDLMKPKAELPVAPRTSPRGTQPTTVLTDMARQCWLDRFIINGKPIGDLTRGEALSAKTREECDARFIELLVTQLPAGSNHKIRDYIKPMEADNYYTLAHQSVAA